MINDSLLNRTYPDEYIDFWGNVYLANQSIKKCGVLFETFLIAPQEILSMVGSAFVADVDDYRPLLAAQRRVHTKQRALSGFERACCNLRRALH